MKIHDNHENMHFKCRFYKLQNLPKNTTVPNENEKNLKNLEYFQKLST